MLSDMAQRPIWRGHLRLALVSCPVALFNARHDRSAIRFNMINPDTGNRIKTVMQDAETGKPVERRNLVKGYEFKKDHYIILKDEDFDGVKVETSSTMAVEKFVDAGSIDPMYYDAAYFLAPDGKAGEDVYAVLREAIATTGKVALTRVVIAQRERTVALRPMGDGLMAHTLHEDRDLNSSKELFDDAAKLKTDPEMVALATQLVRRQAGRYDPSDIEDRYETRLRAMLDAKIAGEGYADDKVVQVDDSNVIDLMAALKRSLRGPEPAQPEPVQAKRTKARAPDRTQSALKLPIKGGKSTPVEQPAAEAPSKRVRNRA